MCGFMLIDQVIRSVSKFSSCHLAACYRLINNNHQSNLFPYYLSFTVYTCMGNIGNRVSGGGGSGNLRNVSNDAKVNETIS